MSVSPVTEDKLLDVPTFTITTAAHTYGSDPVPSTSHWVRDSEQVTASKAPYASFSGRAEDLSVFYLDGNHP